VGKLPNLAVQIGLYTLGIALVMMAILIILKGLGILTALPDYVAWAMVLFALGGGILSGLQSSKR
jgi:hypothetical protein